MKLLLRWWVTPQVAVVVWVCFTALSLGGVVSAQGVAADPAITFSINPNTVLTSMVGVLLAFFWRTVTTVHNRIESRLETLCEWKSEIDLARAMGDAAHARISARLQALDHQDS